jgi:hypothetical protein
MGLVAKCEREAFSLGSRLADAFNAPVGQQDWNERSFHDEIVEHLGFAPWIKDGIAGSGGLTLLGNKAADVAKAGGWVDRHIEGSPYQILDHKWIYMLGDSTTRQVWASYAAPFQGNSFERNAKEWSRQYCNRQKSRKSHPGGKNHNPYFADEGWGGPCGVNEVTCHVSGYGSEGLLTFDWKHFPYEDYDDWLWGESGPWGSKNTWENDRNPDILVVQVGLHVCWHGYPAGFYSKHLQSPNTSFVTDHFSNIDKLVKAVDKAVRENLKSSTIVVFMTAGATYVENSASMDECIVRQNRMLSNAAHKYGFAVLERGEIERRLMYKSVQAEEGMAPLTPDVHLAQPAQNIVASSLLRLLTCLNTTNATPSEQFLGDQRRHTGVGASRPLHSPP